MNIEEKIASENEKRFVLFIAIQSGLIITSIIFLLLNRYNISLLCWTISLCSFAIWFIYLKVKKIENIESEFDFEDEKTIEEWSRISEDSFKEDDDDFDMGPIEEETMG